MRCGNATTTAKTTKKPSSDADLTRTPQPEKPSSTTRKPSPTPVTREVTTPILLKVNNTLTPSGRPEDIDVVDGRGGQGKEDLPPPTNIIRKNTVTPAPSPSTLGQPITDPISDISTDSTERNAPVLSVTKDDDTADAVGHIDIGNTNDNNNDISKTNSPVLSTSPRTKTSSIPIPSSTYDQHPTTDDEEEISDTVGGSSVSRENTNVTPKGKSFVIHDDALSSSGLRPTTPPPIHTARNVIDFTSKNDNTVVEGNGSSANDSGSTPDAPVDREVFELSNPVNNYDLGTNTVVDTDIQKEYTDYPDPLDAMYDNGHNIRDQGGFVNLDSSDYDRDAVFEFEEVDRDYNFNGTLEGSPTAKGESSFLFHGSPLS